MTVTRNQLVQDPLAWPWPGGRWRAIALGANRGAGARSTTAVRAAFVALEAVVLVIALSIVVGLGSVGLAGAQPGAAPGSAPSIEVRTVGAEARALPGPLLRPAPAPGR